MTTFQTVRCEQNRKARLELFKRAKGDVLDVAKSGYEQAASALIQLVSSKESAYRR